MSSTCFEPRVHLQEDGVYTCMV